MSPQKRIKIIKLIEKVERNPEYSEKIKVKNKSYVKKEINHE